MHAGVAPSFGAFILLDGGSYYKLERLLKPAGPLGPAARAVCHTFPPLSYAGVCLLASAVPSEQEDHRLEDEHSCSVNTVSYFIELYVQYPLPTPVLAGDSSERHVQIVHL
jgi:hypothetical protein